MKHITGKIWASSFWWIPLLLVVVLANVLAAGVHARFDLTREKRYTLSNASKEILRGLDQPVEVEVLLKGDFPAGFRKLANAVQEFLQECREYAGPNLQVKMVNPFANGNDSTIQYLKDSLRYFYGLNAYTLQAPSHVGDELSVKEIIPGALIHYRDTTVGVDILKGIRNYGTEPEQLAALYNNAEATLEFRFLNTIQKITSGQKPLIGYALGNGEAWGFNANDMVRTLIREYRFDTVNIHQEPYIPSAFAALVIAKPTIPFTDAEKVKIDQYVMRGGTVFWMIDNLYAEFDSLRNSNGFIAYDRGLNLEDILFNYGVRLNQNLLQDMQCDQLGQMTGDPNNPEMRLVDWPYFPILNGTNHPISKNLDGVLSMFPNTLDTVKAAGIRKTFLLRSSPNARVLNAPAKVDFSFLEIAPDIREFTVRDTTVAALLEGRFRSLYANRAGSALRDSLKAWGVPFRSSCAEDTKMIVVADGDIALNQYSPQYGPAPMGYNFYTRYTYSNKEFFLNALEYLVNPSGILDTRAKEFTLRLLDPVKVREQKQLWQFVNIGLPVLLVVLSAFAYQALRKRKYA